MSDSTSFDTTAIIIIDSTATDAQNLQATVANALVEDYASTMGPISIKCDSLAGQTESIKDRISGMTPSNTSIFDDLLANAMNASFQSSAWAMISGAVDGVKDILDQCDYFKDVANEIAKYADPSKYIKTLAKAAAEKAEQAIDAIADKFGGAGNFPELGIGKDLAAIAATGRQVYDRAQKELENIGDALSPIIEYGKSAVNAMETALSAAAKQLAKLDKLVNCLTAIGGPDYADVIDGMIEELDCYYDKLGVFSDPSLPNFGEFDFESYLGSIGSISGNTEVTNNIKKGINLYSKSRANAEGAIAKLSDLGTEAASALDPASTSDSIEKKKEYISEVSKTSYSIPGLPGKTEDRIVTIPEPEPITPPPISSGEPPDPDPGTVPYSTFITETEFLVDHPIYDLCDPTHGKGNQYLTLGYQSFSHIKVEEPDSSPNIRYELEVLLIKLVERNKYADETKTDVIHTVTAVVAARILLSNQTTNRFALGSSTGSSYADKWYTEDELPISQSAICSAVNKGIRDAILGIRFSESDVNATLGGFF
jgi:hypothetical protein